MSRLRLFQSPVAKNRQENQSLLAGEDEKIFEDPRFEHYEATSNLQLFFDLFFVANLTSFTNVHEINDRHKLTSYIGFIALLWFTWAQVTLYDIRFATDSVFERLAHACHFGVMVGFAVIGPSFLETHEEWGPQQQMSIILMASRLVLFCQYGAALCFTWRYHRTRTPLLIIMGTLLVAAAIYLGISFVFYRHLDYHCYIVWYVVSVLEAVINVGVASWWPVVSLYKAHLVERMTCLTLIILGEGIIGLTKTIVKVETMDSKFTSADIGMIISAVLIIYFVYQIYFDSICLEALSHIQQQIWGLLHFPFHLALCLMMEGINQTLLWSHIVADSRTIFLPLNTALDNDAAAPELKTVLNNTITYVYSNFDSTQDVWDDVQKSMNETLALPDSADTDEVLETAFGAVTETMKTVIEAFGWEMPTETLTEGAEGFWETAHEILKVFNLTFGYFVICTGIILMLSSVFSMLASKHDREHYHLRYLSTIINSVVGLGIALLSCMTLTDSAETLGASPWALPGLMLIMLVLLIIHHLPRGRYESVVKEPGPEC
ncbi:hypothetical protein ASPWEDRAFT_26443 [Aspergillus wentii DTO 134E9]|uniref:Low temperature requirement A n=1 Tax=Aspergillus wentii DTO 134E9 TaxID=1073089 RepID=A0A1L9RPY3_ASPWE|nr:uncharacterized protein ASPWEDRAFT_26443 [Aspergillus wentii DTO 134E9]KAI9923854.1 hypothetical protein MW887_008159 [Aspergillus wentii]OJJ37016.1 hypothetical protein ASPWEDRAFT_26443 [Aspergillus wentii DTO 134E9]